MFRHNLLRLWLKTNPFTGEANWSHAICVPVIGLYYLYIHREDLIKAHSSQFVFGRLLRPWRALAAAVMIGCGAGIYLLTRDHTGLVFAITSAGGESIGILGILVLLLDWSIATLLFGLAMFVYGIYPGRDDYVSDLGMVITLFGIVLMLCGKDVMKIAWFPILFLIVALPWPGLVYSWVAEPLSQLAAHVAVHALNISGVESVCSGTKIVIINQNPALAPRILNVAEACAGMRSLMTFIAVAGAVAFLAARPLWQRLIIVASAVPIAIFCNVMRISGQGLLDHYDSHEWSESFAHQFVGMIMLLPAFFLILLVAYMLDKVFIEEADDDNRRYTAAAPVSAVPVRREIIPPVTVAAAPSISTPRAVINAPVVNRVSTAVPQPAAAAKPRPVAPVTPPRPVGLTPPRPVTGANPRPRAVPVNAPAMSGKLQNGRPPAVTRPAAAPVNGPRTAVNPAPTRPPEVRPVNVKPKEAP